MTYNILTKIHDLMITRLKGKNILNWNWTKTFYMQKNSVILYFGTNLMVINLKKINDSDCNDQLVVTFDHRICNWLLKIFQHLTVKRKITLMAVFCFVCLIGV